MTEGNYYAQRRVDGDCESNRSCGNAAVGYRHRKSMSGAPILLRRKSTASSGRVVYSQSQSEALSDSARNNGSSNADHQGSLGVLVPQRPRTAPPAVPLLERPITRAETLSMPPSPLKSFAVELQNRTPAHCQDIKDVQLRMPRPRNTRWSYHFGDVYGSG